MDKLLGFSLWLSSFWDSTFNTSKVKDNQGHKTKIRKERYRAIQTIFFLFRRKMEIIKYKGIGFYFTVKETEVQVEACMFQFRIKMLCAGILATMRNLF